ncbi:MAG TPA: sigma-70 family RNA polymerase sigma factor [Cyclobacteriaceae bacterium]|nr:sigma-70 family RNA polymerase sigma factor [Cyclobacteriaceae bacterium]HRX00032.1 sigma-70 family RNA polymerase sigma factor [Cyclobacteriaceae bacterium]
MTQAQTIALYHPLLHGIAMRFVKCKADAEDIVQDTFLKWLSIDTQKVRNTKAYLIKSVTNNCLNHLEALKRKKEEYMESIHLPELVTKFKELDFSQIDLHVDLQAALSVIHQKLEPLERAVFVLREVFNVDYEALQVVLEKKKEHCRQLLSRAKKKLSDETSKIHIDFNLKAAWIENFKKACETGLSTDLIMALKP